MNRKVMASLFTMELRKLLTYRLDFWVQFVGTVVAEFLVAWFLWKAVFSFKGLDQISGYHFNELMFYYFMVPLFSRLIRGFDNFVLSAEIYNGSLTRYLIYPVPFFGYKYVLQISRASVALLQLGLGVGTFAVFYGFPESYSASVSQLAMCLGLAWTASLCYFFMAAATEMVAFWADNVWSLMVMLRFLIQMLGGALIPIDLYPEWARQALMYTPFPHLIFVPIRLFMGQAGVAEFLHSAAVLGVWAILFYGLSSTMWRAGTREYSGVGI